MTEFATIAIGASLGGVEALTKLVSQLDEKIAAAILLVLHVGRGPSYLPDILGNVSRLPVKHGEDGEPARAGRIYVAPPDHHMVLQEGLVHLSRGPRENWSRPALDPLFRTIAADCGRRAIGVVLTGGLNDGTAGLYAIRRAGGIAVVQDPDDAEVSEMPASALRYAGADFCPPLREIPSLLAELALRLSLTGEAGSSRAGGRSHG